MSRQSTVMITVGGFRVALDRDQPGPRRRQGQVGAGTQTHPEGGTPERIQRERSKGWRMPEDAIYVGRPTRWGNPHRWSDYAGTAIDDSGEAYTVPAEERRRFAVIDFEAEARYRIGATDYPSIEEIRAELAGHDLVCWCLPGHPCHADVLLDIANSDQDLETYFVLTTGLGEAS